jgi:hypothetical protein
VYEELSMAYPSEFSDRVSSKELEGVGSEGKADPMLLFEGCRVGVLMLGALRLLELIGREKLRCEALFLLPDAEREPFELLEEVRW